MATTHTVVNGDTLWAIAVKYFGNGNKYKDIAAWNNIKNPDRIYIGQVLKLSNTGGSTTSKTNSNAPEVIHFGEQSNNEGTLFATWKWHKASETEEYETWWDYDTGDGVWFVQKSSVKAETEAEMQCTFSIPQNAKTVRFKVKPISKKKKQGNKEVDYWTANWSTVTNKTTWKNKTPLAPPSEPKVEIVKGVLKATLEELDIKNATHIHFQVVKDNKGEFAKGDVKIVTGYAAFTCNVDAGSTYKVRCYAYADKQTDGYKSDWSLYSSEEEAGPKPVSKIESIEATSETSVYLKWTKVETASPIKTITYDIEYAEKLAYFDNAYNVDIGTASTQDNTNFITIYNLTSGKEYFFRVRSKNDKEESRWTEPKSVVVGTTPAQPTTWSSATTAVVGEEVVLYWVHNSEDGSSQTYAELELKIGNSVGHENDPIIPDSNGELTFTINNSKDDKDPNKLSDKTSSCSINTSTATLTWVENGTTITRSLTGVNFAEGHRITWRVQTAGVTNKVGEWSIERTIDVYAQPSLNMSLGKVVYHIVEENDGVYTKTDDIVGYVNGEAVENAKTTDDDQVYRGITEDDQHVYYCYELVDIALDSQSQIPELTSFPFFVRAYPTLTGNQTPTGYHLYVVANEPYETTDNLGNLKMVSAGEQIYSKYFDVKFDLMVELSAGNIDLQNNVGYTIVCIVSMSSGLTAEASIDINVVWTDLEYTPNAEIGIDTESLTASIRPYCDDRRMVYRQVEKVGRSYKMTDTILDFVYGELVKGAITDTGKRVYNGICADVEEGNESLAVYFCEDEIVTPVTDVYLSVYRREFDGGFTELASMLDGRDNTAITDPHPALDLARYRVVATSKTTGSVSYYDLPGVPVNGQAVIIQWDENWSSFETTEDAVLSEPVWTGSMLKLPYNIDVSDNTSPEVELVSYVGRKHPVSYYGTQRGQSATWKVAIDKEDIDTLYGLRRLAMWMGDVYVREPSGSGYWANIRVSFSQSHKDLTIPVSLNITRVEGGV